MGNYYADTSVLVKRHVPEVGSAWVVSLLKQSNSSLTIAAISKVEVVSALRRRVREATLSLADYAQILQDFNALCATQYKTIALTDHVIVEARQLLERHPLRAYDAVQLASALISNALLVNAGAPSLTFLSADTRLLAAAQSEGLQTDNPEQYASPSP